MTKLTRLHKAQTISYLKVVDRSVALLLNFGAKAEIERLYPVPRPVQSLGKRACPLPPAWPDHLLSPELTFDVLGSLMQVHSVLGPGFIHRIYANAVYHEFKLRGLEVVPRREYQVFYSGRPVGGL